MNAPLFIEIEVEAQRAAYRRMQQHLRAKSRALAASLYPVPPADQFGLPHNEALGAVIRREAQRGTA